MKALRTATQFVLVVALCTAGNARSEQSAGPPSMADLAKRPMSVNLEEARTARLEDDRSAAVSLYSVALRQAEAAGVSAFGGVLEEARAYFGELGSTKRLRPAMKRYLELREGELGRDDPELLKPLSHLLKAAVDADDPLAAQEIARRMLEVIEAHPEVDAAVALSSLREIHGFYVQYVRRAEARRSHPHFDVILARNSAMTEALATLYGDMAQMYRGPGGDTEKAVQYWTRSLEVWEVVAGPESPEAVALRAQLATVQQAMSTGK